MALRKSYSDRQWWELYHTANVAPGDPRDRDIVTLCGRAWQQGMMFDLADTIAARIHKGRNRRCRECMASPDFELLVLAWIGESPGNPWGNTW